MLSTTRYILKNGEKCEKATPGSTFSLLEVREKLQAKDIGLMRLYLDNKINKIHGHSGKATSGVFGKNPNKVNF